MLPRTLAVSWNSKLWSRHLWCCFPGGAANAIENSQFLLAITFHIVQILQNILVLRPCAQAWELSQPPVPLTVIPEGVSRWQAEHRSAPGL